MSMYIVVHDIHILRQHHGTGSLSQKILKIDDAGANRVQAVRVG